METVYEKYKAASEYLMEYYTWVDLLGIERREFEEHAEAIEKHCNRLYANFEKASAEERKREENSKSARIAKKLEQMRICLLYTSPSPRDLSTSRMPSSA